MKLHLIELNDITCVYILLYNYRILLSSECYVKSSLPLLDFGL